MNKIYYDEDVFREKDILYLRDLVLQNQSYFNFDDEGIKVCKDKDYLKVSLENGKSIEIKPRYVGHLNQFVGYHAYLSNEIVDSKLRYDLRFVNDEYYGEITKILLNSDFLGIVMRDDLSAATICDHNFRNIISFDNHNMEVNSKRGKHSKMCYAYDFSNEADLIEYNDDSFAQNYMKHYNRMKIDINGLKFSKKDMDIVISAINEAIANKNKFDNQVNEEMTYVKK